MGTSGSVSRFWRKVRTALAGQFNELLSGASCRTLARPSGASLRNRRYSSGSLIVAGDFRIDLSRRSVEIQGIDLRLSPAEFELLVFLTGHHQSVVTPNTMLATRWSGKDVRQAEFVRVLLSLRKKVDSAVGSATSYIRTEPWIFYRFDPIAHGPKVA